MTAVTIEDTGTACLFDDIEVDDSSTDNQILVRAMVSLANPLARPRDTPGSLLVTVTNADNESAQTNQFTPTTFGSVPPFDNG